MEIFKVPFHKKSIYWNNYQFSLSKTMLNCFQCRFNIGHLLPQSWLVYIVSHYRSLLVSYNHSFNNHKYLNKITYLMLLKLISIAFKEDSILVIGQHSKKYFCVVCWTTNSLTFNITINGLWTFFKVTYISWKYMCVPPSGSFILLNGHLSWINQRINWLMVTTDLAVFGKAELSIYIQFLLSLRASILDNNGWTSKESDNMLQITIND